MPETPPEHLPKYKRVYCVIATDLIGDPIHRRTYQSNSAAMHRLWLLREAKFWKGQRIASISITEGWVTWDHTTYSTVVEDDQ